MDMINEALHVARADASVRARGALGSELVVLPIGANCAKTEAGRAEIQARALLLSRAARTLLVIMDASRPAMDWLGMVHGSTQADLDKLLEYGLIEIQSAPKPSSTSRQDPLLEAVNALTYGELYTLLTDQARARLGLIKGYRVVLDVEKCSGLPELQELAKRFLAQVREETGDAGTQALRKVLGI